MSTLRVSTPAGHVTLRDDRTHVVGRARDADVVVADNRVSRNHVLLEPGAGEWLARDTSANGMWHDGKRVSTATISAASVRLRLGAADGPEIVMVVARQAGPPPPEEALDEAATVFAPGGNRPPRAVPEPAAVGGAGSPSAAMHWLRVLPTLLWLAATGFALGALIALS